MKNRIKLGYEIDMRTWVLFPSLLFSMGKKQIVVVSVFLCFIIGVTIEKDKYEFRNK